MDHRPTIAVDFDGCICEHAFPECGKPRQEVIELLRALHVRGWRIVIHSCRTNSDWVAYGASEEEIRGKVDDMLAWLYKQRVPYTSIWGIVLRDPSGVEWDYDTATGKPVADVYLDDRALNGGERTADQMLEACGLLVARSGDPLQYHHSRDRSAES